MLDGVETDQDIWEFTEAGAQALGRQLLSQRPPRLHGERRLVLGDDLPADMIQAHFEAGQVTRSRSSQATISSTRQLLPPPVTSRPC